MSMLYTYNDVRIIVIDFVNERLLNVRERLGIVGLLVLTSLV